MFAWRDTLLWALSVIKEEHYPGDRKNWTGTLVSMSTNASVNTPSPSVLHWRNPTEFQEPRRTFGRLEFHNSSTSVNLPCQSLWTKTLWLSWWEHKDEPVKPLITHERQSWNVLLHISEYGHFIWLDIWIKQMFSCLLLDCNVLTYCSGHLFHSSRSVSFEEH